MAGPMNPPRFPMELMSPTAAAAADAVRETVGSTQKGEGQKELAQAVRQSQNMTIAKDCPGITLSPRNTAVHAKPPPECFRRSLLWSEDRPDKYMTTMLRA